MRVLVVDDDEMVRCVLSEKLSATGFSVTVAEDGHGALDVFGETPYDAVLLDLKMPGMDGIDTLKELRRRDPRVPVIMVTAFGDIATAVESIKLGAYDFVEKPPQISRIVVTLRRAIEKAALEREVRELEKSIEETATLKQAYEKLKELDRMKTAFLSSVSHELRTPLTSIIGYADITMIKLRKLLRLVPPDNPKPSREISQIEENLTILSSEAAKLTKLIDNVLELTALEAGTTKWTWESISIPETLKTAMESSEAFARAKGLELTTTIEDDLPRVRSDRNSMVLVLTHLLSNAIKFTEQGGITCSVKMRNDRLEVSVADTGCGIPANLHEVIFEKFRQIGDILTGKPKGIGLGLPICRLIVEHHGGTIAVASEPGAGSVFTISLPVE